MAEVDERGHIHRLHLPTRSRNKVICSPVGLEGTHGRASESPKLVRRPLLLSLPPSTCAKHPDFTKGLVSFPEPKPAISVLKSFEIIFWEGTMTQHRRRIIQTRSLEERTGAGLRRPARI